MKNDKYDFLYHYARSSFDDELQRFKNIEDKASKYISLFSILIVGFTALIRFSGSSLFPATNILDWITVIVVLITYISFISSWSFLFRALKFTDMPRLPLDDAFLDDYRSKDLPTNQYGLTVTCKEALHLAREANTKKSKFLIKAHSEISISVCFLSLSLILLSLSTLNKGNIQMPENSNEKQPSQTQQQSQPEPDFNATAPKVVMVLDHAIPKSNQGGKTLNETKKP